MRAFQANDRRPPSQVQSGRQSEEIRAVRVQSEHRVPDIDE